MAWKTALADLANDLADVCQDGNVEAHNRSRAMSAAEDMETCGAPFGFGPTMPTGAFHE